MIWADFAYFGLMNWSLESQLVPPSKVQVDFACNVVEPCATAKDKDSTDFQDFGTQSQALTKSWTNFAYFVPTNWQPESQMVCPSEAQVDFACYVPKPLEEDRDCTDFQDFETRNHFLGCSNMDNLDPKEIVENKRQKSIATMPYLKSMV